MMKRALEILPAGLVWSTFAGIIIFSFVAPWFVASLILVYVFYWFAKSFLMSYHLVLGYLSYRRVIHTNWLEKLERDPATNQRWRAIWHLVIVANGTESLPIITSSCEALARSRYPLDRLLIVVANEARFPEITEVNQGALHKQFAQTFGGFWTTTHPDGIVGEVKGKGANISYAAKTILSELAKRGLKDEDVLVTTLDGDHRVHPHFFANLTWTYLYEPNRTEKTYQPLPMFFNNIWSVPFAIRSVAVGSSFWQMIEATRPYRLRNFAAQTQSLAMLRHTDFWSTETIVEDGHQYWRSYFATDGRHEVVPIFIPIYQDAVLSPDGHLMTYREQYLQKRRWAWGASDIPYALTELWQRRRTLPGKGWLQALRLIEGHYSWATSSLILAVFGWFPTLLNPAFRTTVLSYNFTFLYHRMLGLAMLGMVVSLVISRLLLPPRPKRSLSTNYLVEWLLTPFVLPIANIIFGTFPAIDAQTRLALGRYLGFRITEKAVVRGELPVTSP